MFQSTEVVKLKFTAEFDRIHKANTGGNWTGEAHDEPEYWDHNAAITDLAHPERAIKCGVRGRGTSSPDDIEFPKIRVEIPDTEDLDETVFHHVRNFRMNTHVSTNPKTPHTGAGRLNSELSPYREGMAYEVAAAMGIATPMIRRVLVDYTDTGLKTNFTRKALIIETDKNVAERYGATISTVFPEENKIPIRVGAFFHLFQVLIGNGDSYLKLKNEATMGTENYRPYFNTTVFDLPDGTQFPMAYDFDYSSFVAGLFKGESPRLKPLGLQGNLGINVEMLAHFRSRLSKSEYDQAIADYQSHHEEILNAIRKADVDEEGRQNALEHVKLLDQAIPILAGMPMLIKDGVRFYKDAGMKTDLLKQFRVSEVPGTLRPGILVKVLKDGPRMIKIAVSDYKLDLVDSNKNVGYIRKEDLVLGFNLPEDLQGQVNEHDRYP